MLIKKEFNVKKKLENKTIKVLSNLINIVKFYRSQNIVASISIFSVNFPSDN